MVWAVYGGLVCFIFAVVIVCTTRSKKIVRRILAAFGWGLLLTLIWGPVLAVLCTIWNLEFGPPIKYLI